MLSVISVMAQDRRVVLVTVDGYRWQELFGGADSVLINTPKFGNVDMMKRNYWRTTQEERRRALMPFVWDYIAHNGLMLGDRWAGCRMSVTNHMWFSYPGYSEIVCGHADDKRVNSNNAVPNPNVSLFEVANNMPSYKDSVLIFGSWGRFTDIFNEGRSHLPVNANYRHALTDKPTAVEKAIDRVEELCPKYWEEERFDFITHAYALEAMRTRHPKLVFIGYGDTDEWAHAGNYRLYLDAAHSVDTYLRELWELIESDPFYRGRTTVIVTCDHGRGDTTLDAWRNHGYDTPHSDQTWLMAFGCGVPAKGVVSSGEYFTRQIAPAIEKMLGE